MIHANDAIIFMKWLGEGRGVEGAAIPQFRAARNWERAEIARYTRIHSHISQTSCRIAGCADRLSTWQQTIAKILVGNNCRYRHSERLPQAFVVPEKERLTPLDGTSEGAAELVSTKRKRRR